jgi:hypothetical protein
MAVDSVIVRRCGVLGVALFALAACADTTPEEYYDRTNGLGVPREDQLRVGEGTCQLISEADDAGEPVGEGIDVAYIYLRNAGAGRETAEQVVTASVEHLCAPYADDVEQWQGSAVRDFLDESCLATSPEPTHPGCPATYTE